MKRKRILFLAYYFPPIGGAGVQRTVKFIKYLPDFGFESIVICGPDNGRGRWSPNDMSFMQEVISGENIHRVKIPNPIKLRKNTNRIKKFLNLDTTFDKLWKITCFEKAIQICKNNDIDLIFATMSPFESSWVAMHLTKVFGIPWVADLRDPWALDEMQIYISCFHRAAEKRKMFQCLSSSTAIIMNTPRASELLQKEFRGLSKSKIFTITNGFDHDDFRAVAKKREDGKFRIVHTGYLHTDLGIMLKKRKWIYRLTGGIDNSLDILTRSHFYLIKALERIIEEDNYFRNDIEVVFAGTVSEGDKAIVINREIQRAVKFIGYLNHQESISLIRNADLLFLPMHNLKSGKAATIVPGKTYEYLATGVPILGAVPEGDARQILKQSGSAFICRPDDVETMVKILREVYDKWKKGEKAVNPNFSYIMNFERKVLTEKLANIFDKSISASRR